MKRFHSYIMQNFMAYFNFFFFATIALFLVFPFLSHLHLPIDHTLPRKQLSILSVESILSLYSRLVAFLRILNDERFLICNQECKKNLLYFLYISGSYGIIIPKKEGCPM